jgi:hypothetical protein
MVLRGVLVVRVVLVLHRQSQEHQLITLGAVVVIHK